MQDHACLGFAVRSTWRPLLFGAALALIASGASAQTPPNSPSLDELLSAVVHLKTAIKSDARSRQSLGRERTGSGIVIDDNGLVLTIGYLMMEAESAELTTNDGRTVPADVLGYDHETGFGLLRATRPPKVRPMPFGRAADLKERDPVLAASYGGVAGVAPAVVATRREFAGSWEYLLDSAIFTTPPHSHWSGAALINREGKLVGIGSLMVQDVTGKGRNAPGNLYVPIDLLTPVMADLIAEGRSSSALRPWLGLTMEEVRGRLLIARVAPDSPAEKAGLKQGEVIVGVAGEPAKGLADFYRKLWAQGEAGVTVPLDVLQGESVRQVDVRSMNRLDHLKLNTSL